MFYKYGRYILTFVGILGITLSFVLYKKYFTVPQDTGLSNMIWYQIIPDKWANGNQSNDATTWPLDRNGIPAVAYSGSTLYDIWLGSGLSPWGKDWFVLTDLEQKIAESYSKNNNITLALATSSVLRNRWFGGDFQGIEDNMSYLEDLGVDIVLFKPLWLSHSSIRYDIKDRRHIDPRLTSEFDNTVSTYSEHIGSGYGDTRNFTQSDEEFFKLVAQFHDRGIRVVLDMSLLYIASNNYLVKDVASRGKDSPYYEWFGFVDKKYSTKYQSCDLSFFYNTKDYPGVDNISYHGWGGDCSKIYIRRGVGKNGISDGLYDYYIKIMERRLGTQTINGITYAGADGMRIDAAGEFPHNFLNAFFKDIKKINPDAIVMSEERSADTDPIQYDRANTMSFYPIRLWAEALLLQKGRGLVEGISSLTKRIEQFYRILPIEANVLINYLGSHDTDRILSRAIYINKDLATAYFRQDGTNTLWRQGHFARDAPWISRTDHNAHYIHTQPYESDINLLKGSIAFQFVMPGSPVIYYGDEVGMYGADDPDNRQPMRWNMSDHFPRHTCKKGNTPKEYCRTDGTMETYAGDPTLIEWYKTLISLKKTSLALQEGNVSLNICYQSDGVSSCTHNDKNSHPLWGVYREYNDDHVLYLAKVREDVPTLQVQTNVPYGSRKNIGDNTIIQSDSGGFIQLPTSFGEDGYIVLISVSPWWRW